MSLRLKTVSARSIVLPVETTTAASKSSRRARDTAACPSPTLTTQHPAARRCFSTSSQDPEQTSIIFSNPTKDSASSYFPLKLTKSIRRKAPAIVQREQSEYAGNEPQDPSGYGPKRT